MVLVAQSVPVSVCTCMRARPQFRMTEVIWGKAPVPQGGRPWQVPDAGSTKKSQNSVLVSSPHVGRTANLVPTHVDTVACRSASAAFLSSFALFALSCSDNGLKAKDQRSRWSFAGWEYGDFRGLAMATERPSDTGGRDARDQR